MLSWYEMKKKKCFQYTGALVLGMHDALVELSGIIAGLTFAIEDRRIIIMTGAIAAVAASLSMAAANYQAQRADNNPCNANFPIYHYSKQILGAGNNGPVCRSYYFRL